MTMNRKSRRDFLRQLACIAAGGSIASLMPQLRMMGTALAASSTPSSLDGYKALVCCYLSGGNDAWNMVVPFDAARFGVYTTSRSGTYDPNSNSGGLGLTLPSTSAQIAAQVITDANDPNAATNQYFLHPSMPELQALYAQNQLAFVGNIGPLIAPLTKAEYNADPTSRPRQLYSHSDQENLWHVGTAVDNRFGWGGDSMNVLKPQFPPGGNAQLSPCISISGSNKFEVGSNLFPYQMSGSSSGTTNPLAQLSGVCNPSGCTGTSGQRDVALNQLLGASYQNMFASEYQQTFKRGRDLFALLYGGLNSADGQVTTAFPANNSLGNQLLSVARMIKLSRINNYAARQIYYVRMGGFDLHSGLMGNGGNAHAALLAKVSQAFNAFSQAMAEIGATNEVTTFTMSEFARTLSSNGSGSDHAWGSVQMVMGGAVHGGRLYTQGGGPLSGFPDQSLDNPGNFNRGQFIPGIAVDQYAATLAQWLGVTSANDLATIFPNLTNFDSAHRNLGFVG